MPSRSSSRELCAHPRSRPSKRADWGTPQMVLWRRGVTLAGNTPPVRWRRAPPCQPFVVVANKKINIIYKTKLKLGEDPPHPRNDMKWNDMTWRDMTWHGFSYKYNKQLVVVVNKYNKKQIKIRRGSAGCMKWNDMTWKCRDMTRHNMTWRDMKWQGFSYKCYLYIQVWYKRYNTGMYDTIKYNTI